MNKYILVEWPEIQEYMEHPDYPEDCYFDSKKNVWFIPEDWEYWLDGEDEFFGAEIGDLEDAMG